MQIGERPIGLTHQPFIIAEMSGNHARSQARALAIVEAAAASGAHALKLQTYTADTITLDVDDGAFAIRDAASPWAGRTLHDLYEEAHTPWAWHATIMQRARELGLVCFSTPFDESAVNFLETLDVPAYKIASFENNHLPLIRKVASTGKPLLISTGMASVEEIEEAVSAARDAGCRDLVLLKCTSSYPADAREANVLTVSDMRARFGVEVGLSDHTAGVGVAVAAVAHGATIVEKHFTLSRADGGVDSAFSLEPAELRLLVDETARAWAALGRVHYGPTAAEESACAFRRSVYIAADLEAGAVLTRENVRIVRPGLGLHPRYYATVLGRRLTRDVRKGTPLEWSLLEP